MPQRVQLSCLVAGGYMAVAWGSTDGCWGVGEGSGEYVEGWWEYVCVTLTRIQLFENYVSAWTMFHSVLVSNHDLTGNVPTLHYFKLLKKKFTILNWKLRMEFVVYILNCFQQCVLRNCFIVLSTNHVPKTMFAKILTKWGGLYKVSSSLKSSQGF